MQEMNKLFFKLKKNFFTRLNSNNINNGEKILIYN
jgi:hypothetical protein